MVSVCAIFNIWIIVPYVSPTLLPPRSLFNSPSTTYTLSILSSSVFSYYVCIQTLSATGGWVLRSTDTSCAALLARVSVITGYVEFHGHAHHGSRVNLLQSSQRVRRHWCWGVVQTWAALQCTWHICVVFMLLQGWLGYMVDCPLFALMMGYAWEGISRLVRSFDGQTIPEFGP